MKNAFFDTNILVYSIDPREAEKRTVAIELLQSHSSGWSLSVQVLQEFYWTATRRLRVSPADAKSVTELWAKQRVLQPSSSLVLSAIDTSERYRLSLWDSLIVEAAVAGKCDLIYTEDMQHGQAIRGVQVVNPFNKD